MIVILYCYQLAVQHQIESLERSVREKSAEVKQLQKQNAELERARHTEVVKLRLEVFYRLGNAQYHVIFHM